MGRKEIPFEELEYSDLYVDCIYKGGKVPNMSAEPFHKLIPGCENAGGFRKKLREDGSGKYAYVVLYTSMEELEWPDYLDEETGIFRYYGDNRQFGIMMTTSYVDKQAYSEVVEDGHPILIVTASDVAGILRRNSINSSNIDYYLKSIDEENEFYRDKIGYAF